MAETEIAEQLISTTETPPPPLEMSWREVTLDDIEAQMNCCDNCGCALSQNQSQVDNNEVPIPVPIAPKVQTEFIGTPFLPNSLPQLTWVVDFESYTNRKGEQKKNNVRKDGPKMYSDIDCEPEQRPTKRAKVDQLNNQQMKDKVRQDLKNFISDDRSNKTPNVDPQGFAIRARDGTQTVLFETNEWVANLSPTPYMGQLHLNVWNKNEDNIHIYNFKDEKCLQQVQDAFFDWWTKVIYHILEHQSGTDEEKEHLCDKLSSVQVQFGTHFHPSVFRLHVHILVGDMTDMALNPDNLSRWQIIEEYTNIQEKIQSRIMN